MKNIHAVVLALMLSSLGLPLHAQLVADGTTATINAIVTNIAGNLTIGTNGSFTSLIITNGGVVTNTGTGVIGLNASARTNQVIVTGTNSLWGTGGVLNFGSLGSYSRLTVTRGGRVNTSYGNMAFNGGIGNVAVVSGAGSVWTNRNVVNIGNSGSFNQVFVTNNGALISDSSVTVGNAGSSNQLFIGSGGVVSSGVGTLSSTLGSHGNLAVINGPGSQWKVDSELRVGIGGHFNQMIVTNGAKIFSGGAYVAASSIHSGSGRSNLVLLAGAGSTWTNTATSAVGDIGYFNQLIISNGAVFHTTTADEHTIGFNTGSSNNLMLVHGTNSLFLNRGGNSDFYVGFSGSQNKLFVQGGALVETDTATMAFSQASSNNLVVIANPGSTFVARRSVNVGNSGFGNQLFVTNGGTLKATNLFIGVNASSSNNLVTVTAGNVFITNASRSATLDVRRGTNIFNSGSITADRLFLTNEMGFFEFVRGTLSVGNSIVSNGHPFLVCKGGITSGFKLLGNGLHTFSNGLVISNAYLQGNGTIVGAVTFASSGGLDLRSGSATNKLIFSNAPALGGVAYLNVSKDSGVRTNDQVRVAGNLVYGGALVVQKIGADTLSAGDRFQLFSANSYSGKFNGIYPPLLADHLKWSNRLLIDGSLEVVSNSPPAFASTTQIGTNLVFGLTNGNPSWYYSLLATTNVALPLSNWTSVASGPFDWMGNVTITNGINPAVPARFFRLVQFAD